MARSPGRDGMQRQRLSAKEAAELNRLLDDLLAAIKYATELLLRSSHIDPEYLAADAKVSEIVTRVNELMN